MRFSSFFTQSTADLKSNVRSVAKQLGIKRSKDSLGVDYFYAVPHDPSIIGPESMYDGAEVYTKAMGNQLFFGLDASHSDKQVWKAFSPNKSTKITSINITTGDCTIRLFDNRGSKCYQLTLMLHSRDLDSASKVKLLKSRAPQIFSEGSKDAKIQINLNDRTKIELEQWSQEDIFKVFSESDWYRLVLASPNVDDLKKFFDQCFVPDGEGEGYISASLEKFPTQSELQPWIKIFGVPDWIVVPGNYPTKFDFFSAPEDFPPIGIVRYPWASRNFADESCVSLDIVHRKNLPPLIEVMAFHLDNQKAAAKRAKYLQKKLGSEFQPYEGDPWERFAT